MPTSAGTRADYFNTLTIYAIYHYPFRHYIVQLQF